MIKNGASLCNMIRCKVLNHKILVSVANHEYIYYGYLLKNGASLCNMIRCKVLNHKILVSVANHEYIYYGYLLKKRCCYR